MKKGEIFIERIGILVMDCELTWHKNVGDYVQKGDHLFDARGSVGTIKNYAKWSGTLVEKYVEDGPTKAGTLIGFIDAD